MFLNKDGFYSVKLLASRQTSKLEDYSWSAVHDCLFNTLAAKLHIWMPTPPSATRGDAPCRGDRNPRMDTNNITEAKFLKSRVFNSLEIKSVAYSSQESHTGQLDFCSSLADCSRADSMIRITLRQIYLT